MAIGQAQRAQPVRLKRRLFTLEEYDRMIDAGVFDEDEHIELIRGEIVKMAAIGVPHMSCVLRLSRLLVRKAGDNALVSTQNPIWLPGHSRPEPDLALLKWRDDYYAAKPPMPEDALLIIEVAETSVKDDRTVKGPLYAQAGIPEYWIINLRDNIIEVYTEPSGGAYSRTAQAKRGETLTLPAELGETVEVTDILGKATMKD